MSNRENDLYLENMLVKAEEALANDDKVEAEQIMKELDELGFHQEANEVGHLIEKFVLKQQGEEQDEENALENYRDQNDN